MHAAIFYQNRHVHMLALALALAGLLAMIFQQPAGCHDRGLELAVVAVVLLMAGHTRLRWCVDLRAAHRAGLAAWLATISATLIGGSCVQVYGGTGVSSRPLTHWADGIVLAATSVLMGMLHMSMSPRPNHTLVFLGVVSLTSAATILAAWSEGHCTSAPSSVPVVVWTGATLGLLAGRPWVILQRLLFALSQQYTSLEAGKERLAFDYDGQEREVERLRREIDRLRGARDGQFPASSAALPLQPAHACSSTASHVPNSPHTLPEPEPSVDLSLMSSDDETPLFSDAIKSSAEDCRKRLSAAEGGRNSELALQLRRLKGVQQGPHRLSNYASRMYMQTLHVLRQGQREPGNVLALLGSEDLLHHILFHAMGFCLGEHAGTDKAPQAPQAPGTVVGSVVGAVGAVWAHVTRRRGRGDRGRGNRGRGRGRIYLSSGVGIPVEVVRPSPLLYH